MVSEDNLGESFHSLWVPENKVTFTCWTILTAHKENVFVVILGLTLRTLTILGNCSAEPSLQSSLFWDNVQVAHFVFELTKIQTSHKFIPFCHFLHTWDYRLVLSKTSSNLKNINHYWSFSVIEQLTYFFINNMMDVFCINIILYLAN